MSGVAHGVKTEPVRTVLSDFISFHPFFTMMCLLHSQSEPLTDCSPTVKRELRPAHFSVFLDRFTIHHLQRWALSTDFENKLDEPITFLQFSSKYKRMVHFKEKTQLYYPKISVKLTSASTD